MGRVVEGVGRIIARYLEKPEAGYQPGAPSDVETLRALLKPGDVILVEGNNHIAGVIKYLTQSTWSHAALYVGPIGERCAPNGEPLVLVEANIGEGVVATLSGLNHRLRTILGDQASPFDQVVVQVGSGLRYDALMSVIDICTRQRLPSGEKLTKLSFVELPEEVAQ